MKLYAIRASHNCRRVLATADHLGLSYDLHEPDLAAGELRSPEFRALNPNGKVPTLVDDDLVLWESNAIMQYLAARSPNDLWPDDARARAEIARWQFWESNHLSTGTGPITFERMFKPFVLKQATDEAVVEQATATFHKFAPVLNGQLEGRTFLLGDSVTLADFSVAANFNYAGPAQFPLANYTHIKKWLGALDNVPAWKNTAPRLG